MLHLNVLCWNVFMRTRRLFSDGQLLRAGHIGRLFKENAEYASSDVVVLCEVFDAECADMLSRAMSAAGFVHQTRVLGADEHRGSQIVHSVFHQQRLLVMNGGVVIYSRHPILEHHSRFFHGDAVAAVDACAMKGFIYARIKFPSREGIDASPCRIVHVVGTHLQATRSDKGDVLRQRQIGHIRRFLRTQVIPPTEPVVIVGDLNQDKMAIKMLPAFVALLEAGDVQSVPHRTIDSDDAIATIHPFENNLVGRDLDSSVPLSCVDHCLFSKAHLHPCASLSSCVTLKGTAREVLRFGLPDMFYKSEIIGVTTHHLSDHYALLARLVFSFDCPTPTTEAAATENTNNNTCLASSFFADAEKSHGYARLVYNPVGSPLSKNR